MPAETSLCEKPCPLAIVRILRPHRGTISDVAPHCPITSKVLLSRVPWHPNFLVFIGSARAAVSIKGPASPPAAIRTLIAVVCGRGPCCDAVVQAPTRDAQRERREKQ